MAYSLLIIDDDKTFCEELSEILSEYHSRYVLNPGEAIAYLERPNDIDLILLDVRLPEMKGTEFLKILKTRYPDVSIIIMTSYFSKESILDALRNRADDFLEKPFDIEELKKMVDRLLREKRENLTFSDDMEYIRYYINKKLDKNVKLADIAATLGYSAKYMSRLFKRQSGIGFSDYKTDIKIGRAKELLKNTDYRIKRIAYELGYENSESFVRIFKKRTGMTPSSFRSVSSG
ncbi:MAG: response regulator [Spirochaetia bacterium]